MSYNTQNTFEISIDTYGVGGGTGGGGGGGYIIGNTVSVTGATAFVEIPFPTGSYTNFTLTGHDISITLGSNNLAVYLTDGVTGFGPVINTIAVGDALFSQGFGATPTDWVITIQGQQQLSVDHETLSSPPTAIQVGISGNSSPVEAITGGVFTLFVQ